MALRRGGPPRIYLAGPEVFRPDAHAEGARLKALCAAEGVEGLYPLDTTQDDPGGEDALAIRAGCIGAIGRADAVVANISPFRGAHMDPGTAFEIGYAEACGLPVFLWSSDPRPLKARVPATPADGGLRDADGHLVEDFDQPENLMIAGPGARVHPSPEAAIAEAAGLLRRLQEARDLRVGLFGKVLIALAASAAVSYLVNRLVGW